MKLMVSSSSKLFVPQSDSRTRFGLQCEHTERTHTLSRTSRGTPVSTAKPARRSSNSRLPSNNRIVSRKANQGTRAVVSPPCVGRRTVLPSRGSQQVVVVVVYRETLKSTLSRIQQAEPDGALLATVSLPKQPQNEKESKLSTTQNCNKSDPGINSRGTEGVRCRGKIAI